MPTTVQDERARERTIAKDASQHGPFGSQTGYGFEWRRLRELRLDPVFTQPDYFDVRPHNVQLDCSTAGTAASGTRLAEVRVDGTEVHTENTVYDLQGYLSTSYRATVLIR